MKPSHFTKSVAVPALLLAIAVSMIGCSGARAQDATGTDRASADRGLPPVYRIELIVFAHTQGRSDRIAMPEPADFTDRLDPLLLSRTYRAAESAAGMLRRTLGLPRPGSTSDQPRPFLQSEEVRLEPIPPPFAALDETSPTMRRALERLRNSVEHEVLLTRSWTQTAERSRSTPHLRLHDRNVVATLAPPLAAAPPWVPTGVRVPVQVSEDRNLESRRMLQPQAPGLEIYRLDGSARLNRRRFLHLELDLVWQQRALGLPETAGQDAGLPLRGPSMPADAQTEAADWLLHRMSQSRVIQPGRLEYFDSDRFGVLALVQRFEQVLPEPATQSGSPAGPENARTPDDAPSTPGGA